MKKLWIALCLLLCLAMPLFGCGQEEPEEGPISAPEPVIEEPSAVEVTGGWTITEDVPGTLLTEEDAALLGDLTFNGKEDENGWVYVPVTMIAEKTGKDGAEKYAALFHTLCGDDNNWCVVTLDMTDPQEDGSVMKYICPIDPVSYSYLDKWEGLDEEGWHFTVSDAPQAPGTDKAIQAAVDTFVKEEAQLSGSNILFGPIATQVVAGTNYLFLAETVPEEGDPVWAFVTVYEDLDGNCTVLDYKYMDLMSFIEW